MRGWVSVVSSQTSHLLQNMVMNYNAGDEFGTLFLHFYWNSLTWIPRYRGTSYIKLIIII